MIHAIPATSKEEKFQRELAAIGELFKKNSNSHIALNSLSELSVKINHYLIKHPNSRPSNTLKIFICSIRAKIFDDLESYEEARSNWEEMRRRLMQPYQMSSHKVIQFFTEYSNFLAIHGEYQLALQIGYEAFSPNADGNVPLESLQWATLRYHLGKLHTALNDSRKAIREYKHAFNFYIQYSGPLEETIFLAIFENLAELYLEHQSLPDFLSLYTSHGDFYLHKKEYGKSTARYQEGLDRIKKFLQIYPNTNTPHLPLLIKALETKMANAFSEQGKYAEAHSIRTSQFSCNKDTVGQFSSCHNFFQPLNQNNVGKNLFIPLNNLIGNA